MAGSREYDIIIFGVTGVTGLNTVLEIQQVAEAENVKWAVAGRNMAKIQKALSEASKLSVIGQSLEETPVLIADIESPASLVEMAAKTNLVINCVGPYRFYGEPVVKACIEAGTHHLDVSGEPEYLGKMEALYNSKAKEKEVFIIGAAGFDSVPNDMGVLYTRQQFGEGVLTNVEAILTIHSGSEGVTINTGTMESAMHAATLSSQLEVAQLRKTILPVSLPKPPYYLSWRWPFSFSKETKKWLLPFPEGTDETVVNRTNRELLNDRKINCSTQFSQYLGMTGLVNTLKLSLFAIMFVLLANIGIGRKLLMMYPHIFTLGLFKRGGPTEKQIKETSFTMELIGHGFTEEARKKGAEKPDKTIQTRIEGPELAYRTTPICLVQCALTILKHKEKISQKGGVLTPGSVFVDTNLIERLNKRKVKFSTIRNKDD